MSPARSYVVIGGGVVGAASALRLRAAGFEVTLLDAGDPRRGASFGNIGHVAAEQGDPMPSAATLLSAFGRLFAFGGPLDFRLTDARLWGPWAARFVAASRPSQVERGAAALARLLDDPLGAWERLTDMAGAPDDLVRSDGHAVVWMDAEKARRGQAAWAGARTGRVVHRPLEPEELAAYDAVLNRRPAAGLAFTGTGQVSEPYRVRDALLADFERRGGRCAVGVATGLKSSRDGVQVATAVGEILEAEGVLVAAGAWSGQLMASLGVRAPVIGERGYSVQSPEHDWPESLPLTVFEDRALVTARFTGGLRASSHVEFGDPSAPPDPRKWASITGHLKQLGIRFSPAPDLWCGPRPTLPDYLPAIGRLQADPRVLYAFGHQHLGLTLAAVTAEQIERLALGEPAESWVDALRIERFSRAS